MNERLWHDYESNMLNQGVSDLRLKKLRVMFNMVSKGIKKPINKATRKDIERFLDDLNRNKFVSKSGEPYSGNSKCDMKKFLKQYFKWLKGNNEFYPPEVAWIKTKIRKDERPDERPILTREEVIKLAMYFKKPEYRIITLLLFDSGFRISEMQSVRKKDITFEEFEPGKKCFWLQCSKSKTIPRKIPVGLFTEDIQNFLNSAYMESLNPDDLIWPMTYTAIAKALKNAIAKTIKKKNVSFHAFRHSSATMYAKLYDGNSMLLAERYGWAYDSKELKIYIRRSGAYQKQGAKKVFDNELIQLKERVKQLEEKLDTVLEKEVQRVIKKIQRQENGR